MNEMELGTMVKKRWLLAVLLWAGLISTGSVQEPEAEAPPAEAEAPPAEPAPPEADESRTLEEIFIPSEEIAADEEVTFPIDI